MVSVQIDIQNSAFTAPFVFMKVVNSAIYIFCEAEDGTLEHMF